MSVKADEIRAATAAQHKEAVENILALGGPGSGNFGHGSPGGAAGVAALHDKAAAAHQAAAQAHRDASGRPRGENFYDSKAGKAAADATNTAHEASSNATNAHGEQFGESQSSDNNPGHAASAYSHAEDATFKETHVSAAWTHDRAAREHTAAAKEIRKGSILALGGPGSGNWGHGGHGGTGSKSISFKKLTEAHDEEASNRGFTQENWGAGTSAHSIESTGHLPGGKSGDRTYTLTTTHDPKTGAITHRVTKN